MKGFPMTSAFNHKDAAHVQAARDIIDYLRENPGSTNGNILRGCKTVVFGFLTHLVEAGILTETPDEIDSSVRRYSYKYPHMDPENVLGDVSRRIVYHVQNAKHPQSNSIHEIAKSVQHESFPVGTIISEENIRSIATANPMFFSLPSSTTLRIKPGAVILAAIADAVYGPPTINAGTFDTESVLGRHVNVGVKVEKAEEPTAELEIEECPGPVRDPVEPVTQSKNIEFRVTYNDDGTVTVDYTGPGEKLSDLMSAALMEL